MMQEPDFPIVEPLSEATGEAICPLKLRSTDYLRIGMDAENVSFEMKVETWRERRPFDPPASSEDKKTATGVDIFPVQAHASASAKDFFYRLPEAKHEGERFFRFYGEWTVGATDYTAILVHHCWPRERLIFRSEAAEITYTLLLKRFLRQTVTARHQALWRLQEVEPAPLSDWVDHPENPAAEYQRVAIHLSTDLTSYALFMDRGTGKTMCSISRICTEARRTRSGAIRRQQGPGMMRVLIVCPNQVRLNWQREFSKFATVAGKVTVLRGPKLKRIRLLTLGVVKDDPELAFAAAIVGYDTIKNDLDFVLKVPWDLIIADESHWFKSPSTRRFQAMLQLRDVSDRRMILTGTPIGNSICDLYAQFEFLGRGLSGFVSWKEFKKFHARLENIRGTGIEAIRGNLNVPMMRERLSRLSFSITKDEAKLGLPDKVYDVHEVEMTKRQADFYKHMLAKVVVDVQASLEKASDSGMNQSMTANHVLTQLLRLAQITSGHVKWDAQIDEAGEVTTEPRVEQIDPGKNPKILAVLDMLRESPKGEKTVIWAVFREDIHALNEVLTQAGVKHGLYYGSTADKDRDGIVDSFNRDPQSMVLVANPATAGTGLNLLGYDPDFSETDHCYCGHEIFFSCNWSYIGREQAEDRAHRRGTKMPVRITDLVVPSSNEFDSIDEEIRSTVAEKGESAGQFRDLQGVLQRVLGMSITGALV